MSLNHLSSTIKILSAQGWLQDFKGRNFSLFHLKYNGTNYTERRPANLFVATSGQHTSWTDSCLNLHHKCSTSETWASCGSNSWSERGLQEPSSFPQRGCRGLSEHPGSFKPNSCGFSRVRETKQFSVQWHKETYILYSP